MNKTQKGIIIGLIVFILLIVIFSFANRKNEEENITKIGAIVILSGDGAAWGDNARKGIELALAENNNKNIKIIFEDSQGDSKKAISSYQKLKTIDQVDAIIGPLLQAEVAALSPIVQEDQLPVITPSYAPIKNRPNPRNPLMIWMDATIEAERMAEYVFKLGIREVGILGTFDNWENEVSEAFAKKFEELGGKIVAKEIVYTDTPEIKTSIAKIVNEKPEAVFLGTYFQFISAVKTLKETKYTGKLFSIEVDAYLASETKEFSEGMEFIAPDFYADVFIKKFEQQYGQKPGIPAGQAYDATTILLTFFKEGKSKEKVIQQMEQLKKYEGVSGDITITKEHKTLLPTAIFEIQKGEIVKKNSLNES